MEKNDIKAALLCVEPLGMTENISTLEAFAELDPAAFYVAINSSDKKVIGVCGAPFIGSNGFMGLYGVDKAFQGHGIGRQLFDLCLKHVGNRNCGLHSVRHKLYIYEHLMGFTVKDKSELSVFTGFPKNIENINVLIDENHEIKEYKSEDKILLTKIIEYDSKVHKQSRQQLLNLILNKSDYKTFALMDKSSDRVLGFGSIRHNIGGVGLIGPVYADNDSIAEILVYNLVKFSEHLVIKHLIYPTLNYCLSSHKIARKLALNQTDSCPTLFTKHILPLNHKHIYCLTSPNFSF